MNVPYTIARLQEANTMLVLVASLSGSSSGSHGYGGDPEWPAPNPMGLSIADVRIDTVIEQQLLGHPCTAKPISAGGSFHERWIDIEIYVTVPYLSIEDANGEYIEGDSVSASRKVKNWIWPPVGPVTFPFEGIKHAIAHVRALAGEDDPDTFPQDSGEWWTKAIDKVKASTPLKRPLDGD